MTVTLRNLFLAVVASTVTIGAGPLRAEQTQFYVVEGFALGGHDAVAYFTRGVSVPGDPAYTLMWRGALWRFESAESMSAFEMNPTAYAPQYGGYCAYSVSQGRLSAGDPDVFKIVGGRLYLNGNVAVQTIWSADVAGHVAAADRNWQTLRKK